SGSARHIDPSTQHALDEVFRRRTDRQGERAGSQPGFLDRIMHRIARHWLPVFIAGSGLFVGLPWLAPVFMHAGWTGPARAVYTLYSFFCHQLPQRSFFLYGPSPMPTLDEVVRAGAGSRDPFSLRAFVGTPELGYKVAWSDRMVSMYTSIPLAALAWWGLRRRLKPLPIWGFALFTLPIVLDGASHMLSDLAGIGQGFRDTNLWLSTLTGGALPGWFYAGDALGSLNSWMRLISGALFGIGLGWFSFPALDESFTDIARQFEARLARE
ncbi:MAG: hypothetical protein ACRDHY_07770, partial [Anaerolineales bacterium]